MPAKFTVHVDGYGAAIKGAADRALRCIQREKRRQFHLKAVTDAAYRFDHHEIATATGIIASAYHPVLALNAEYLKAAYEPIPHRVVPKERRYRRPLTGNLRPIKI